jgi:hypothetical protein
MLIETYMETEKKDLVKYFNLIQSSVNYSVNFNGLYRFFKILKFGNGYKFYTKQFYKSFYKIEFTFIVPDLNPHGRSSGPELNDVI